MVEVYLRRSLIISDGDPTVFFTRPLSAMFLLIAAVALVAVCLPALSKKREEVFSEVD
jgi:TctA family transporter